MDPTLSSAPQPLSRKPKTPPTRLAFVAAPTPLAQQYRKKFTALYGNFAPEEAEVIISIGGDGFMLETLHKNFFLSLPVYGVNSGSVGFLMNPPFFENLPQRLVNSQESFLHPLRMYAVSASGTVEEALALNDVYLFRQTRQTAKIKITVDNTVRLEELVADGVLIATPAGSTAYNLSSHGPIVPLSAELLPLTPISAFRPRRWRGALLPSSSDVEFTVLEPEKRPVAAVADFTEIRNVVTVGVKEDKSAYISVLFDQNHSLAERIIAEQFTV
ncbi:NAD kinase [Entomobacter blattae]|uniref:NAD kinase n=1 Tax=Entomobacter blattae TaxID=2762277 RepID=A0A7H1NPH6_9PROT|nr:NAD kinase [Entomobacter blattae]QNT77686.1 NAD kinase [Entomobacter blattae]